MLSNKQRVLIITPLEKVYADYVKEQLTHNINSNVNIFSSFVSPDTVLSLSVALSTFDIIDNFDNNDNLTIIIGNSHTSVYYDKIYVFEPDIIIRQLEFFNHYESEVDLTKLYTIDSSDSHYHSLEDLIMDLKEEFYV